MTPEEKAFLSDNYEAHFKHCKNIEKCTIKTFSIKIFVIIDLNYKKTMLAASKKNSFYFISYFVQKYLSENIWKSKMHTVKTLFEL